MLNKYLSIITLSIVLCAFSEAQASGVNGSFQVSATVSASCSVSTNDLNFGNYNSGQNGDLDATGQLGVACTNDTSYTIDVGTGLYGNGSSRKLKSGNSATASLNYQIYKDAGRNSVWGEGSGGASKVATGTGGQQSHAMYGRIPAGQSGMPTGAYSDHVIVEVTF